MGWRGKQIFGDLSTQKYKIFFIGDSFTNGKGIKKACMYYNVVNNKLDAEIFVYAGGAYGTLQEYIVLDKYFDNIKPDLVILQVCSNDFFNNLWELESASIYYNQLMLRPYLIDDKIEYRFPAPKLLGRIGVNLSYSRFYYVLLFRIEKFIALLAKKGLVRSVEMEIREKGMELDIFRKSVRVTNRLIAKIKQRVGKTPLVAFSVDDDRPYFGQFKSIFKENDIEFLEAIPEMIRREEQKGINLRLEDGGHFNDMGQQICGKILTQILLSRGYSRGD